MKKIRSRHPIPTLLPQLHIDALYKKICEKNNHGVAINGNIIKVGACKLVDAVNEHLLPEERISFPFSKF